MKVIYAIVCAINNKQYIGSAMEHNVRKSAHFCDLQKNKHCNIKLQNAYNKYGADNFRFIILEEVQNSEDLIPREQFYINTLKPFYNICRVAGNTLGRKHTQEARKKLSASLKRYYALYPRAKGILSPMYGFKHNEETIKKCRAYRHTEEVKKKMKGRKLSEETKKRMSDSKKGKPMHPVQKARLLAANLGIKHSPERLQRRKEAKVQTGDNHWLYGKTHTAESIQKMSASHKARYENGAKGPHSKAILQYTLDGKFIKEWSSAYEASKTLGCTGQAIGNCAHGHTKTSRGFIWRFKTCVPYVLDIKSLGVEDPGTLKQPDADELMRDIMIGKFN